MPRPRSKGQHKDIIIPPLDPQMARPLPAHPNGQTGNHSTPMEGVSSAGSNNSAEAKNHHPRPAVFGFLPFKSGKNGATTKEGQPAKKRGPKPDAKPALNRRQELNRQAQRTHRERKEIYVKEMEVELVKLKETHHDAVKQKNALQHENDRLKQLLSVNGIPYEYVVQQDEPARHLPNGHVNPLVSDLASRPATANAPNAYVNGNHAHGSRSAPSNMADGVVAYPPPVGPFSAYVPAVYAPQGAPPQVPTVSPTSMPMGPTAFPPRKSSTPLGPNGGFLTPTITPPTGLNPPMNLPGSAAYNNYSSPTNTIGSTAFNPTHSGGFVNGNANGNIGTQTMLQSGMNHDDVAIQFIVDLEADCNDHSQFMNVVASKVPNQLSGHALMTTCPPGSHIANTPDVPYPHQAPNLPAADLMRVIDLAAQIPTHGEIPPALALKIIREDERYGLLTQNDWQELTTKLKEKCRCYGFGAVLEEFEVRDALNSIFASKYKEQGVYTIAGPEYR